jgi:hypothetical protein
MAERLNAFTDAQVQWLSRWIEAVMRNPRGLPGSGQSDTGAQLEFIGQLAAPATADLFTGALVAPNNKMKPMRGPAAPDPTTVLWGGETGVTVHYLIGSIFEGDAPWCDVWNWQGFLYIYPWTCGPAGA